MSTQNIIAQIQTRKNNPFSLTDVFDQKYVKEDTVFKEDPLVLACALQDLWQKHERYYNLEGAEVREHITDEIRARAEEIRKHYTKKWFWRSLNGCQLSDFRQRVCYLLENRIRTCNERDVGIYFKLPWFYEEDMIYDDFKKQLNTTDVPSIRYGGMSPVKERLTLTYLKSTISTQNKRKLERFWFSDETYLFSITVTHDNPLLDMFRDMLEIGEPVTFETYRSLDRIDQMHYYKLFKFKFVKEENA